MAVKIINGNNDAGTPRIGIAVAKWNSFITDKLLDGALQVLYNKEISDKNVVVAKCPGAYEIPFTAKKLLPKVDGVITLGAVIRGETPHFDYVCQTANNGVLQLNLEWDKPVVFGVLTTDNIQQATQRAATDSDFGNKGAEAALALLEMLSVKQKIDEL